MPLSFGIVHNMAMDGQNRQYAEAGADTPHVKLDPVKQATTTRDPKNRVDAMNPSLQLLFGFTPSTFN